MDTFGQPAACTELLAFIVPKVLVKEIKTALETQKRSSSRLKISVLLEKPDHFLIPSSITRDDQGYHSARVFLNQMGHASEIQITTVSDTVATGDRPAEHSLEELIRRWVSCNINGDKHLATLDALSDIPKSYSIYGPLLLLPAETFQSVAWKKAFSSWEDVLQQKFYQSICTRFKITHIALNAAIPLHNQSKIPSKTTNLEDDNVLRSPTNLKPLFGDFGPVCTADCPTASDFGMAFWTWTKQNGIVQVWAPRYTMFSRGNISEKARILHLPSVKSAVEQGRQAGSNCTAVDLYAGIGYFAFSYAAAGVSLVLGWDINPWSIEGLRRGAVRNGWNVAVFKPCGRQSLPCENAEHETWSKSVMTAVKEARVVALVESNDKAAERTEALRSQIPPVRHVNLGLLPTSRGSWKTAARVLDPVLGGWVHVHENFAVAQIEVKAEEVKQEFDVILSELDRQRGWKNQRQVIVEHIQRVKSYAPGVFHCVIDLYIGPAPGC